MRRDVWAHTQEFSRERIDELERVVFKIATGAGEQRVQVLNEWRIHELVAMFGKRIDERTTRVLHACRSRRQHIFNKVGENPFAHGAGEAVRGFGKKRETTELLTTNSTEPDFQRLNTDLMHL